MVINEEFKNEVNNLDIKVFDIVGLEMLTDEGDINVKFSFYNFKEQRMETFSILRSQLTPASMKKNIVQRGGVCPKNLRKLCEVAEDYINKIIIENTPTTWSYAHCRIGFRMMQGELVFAADSIYTKDEVIPSRYYGRVPLQPQGDLSEIKELYKVLHENKSVALPLSMVGAASVVLSYSNHKWGTHIYNFIVHLQGTSSTGKSTILKLVASFTGNPDVPNGCFLSYLSTTTSIIESLCDSYGHPYVIDEFSTAKRLNDWNAVVYTISNGMQSGRVYAGGMKLQESKGFEGIYVSSGEISMSCKCGVNKGILARLFEITTDYDYSGKHDEKFTTSCEESDYIKSVASNNYGILAPAVAQKLLQYPDKYNHIRKGWLYKVKSRFVADGLVLNVADRVMEYIAIIMTACEVMQDVLEMSFDIDKIFEYYYFQLLYKHSGDENLDVKVYDAMKSYIVANRRKMYDANYIWGIPALDDEHVGYFVDLSHYPNKDRHKAADGKYYDYLAMFPIGQVQDYLKGRGFEDPKAAMNTLRKRRLIKYTRSGSDPKLDYPIDGINVPMYAIWLDVCTTNVNHASSYI
jgi:hypothetical protein